HYRNAMRSGFDFDRLGDEVTFIFLYFRIDMEKPGALSVDGNFKLLIFERLGQSGADKLSLRVVDQSGFECVIAVCREVMDNRYPTTGAERRSLDTPELIGRFSNLIDVVVADHHRRSLRVADCLAADLFRRPDIALHERRR